VIRTAALCLLVLAGAAAAHAQEVNIYSEFLRFNPYGEVIAPDRESSPREILSPAVPRNGHLVVHVVVTAPSGTNYFLYTGQNPSEILQINVYREYFTKCGEDYCPEWLSPVNLPAFGAIPESLEQMPGQTTRCYLMDIYVPPDVPPRRVRVEALIKVGYWLVAPMEVRVVEPTVPTTGAIVQEDLAPLTARSSDTAQRQLLRYLAGLPPELPPTLLRVRDFIQRNAAEDMLVAQSLGVRTPRLDLLAYTPLLWPSTGAEWYLGIRDLIYRYQP
jgi:hypothetical protein